jgi:hypothetical protein
MSTGTHETRHFACPPSKCDGFDAEIDMSDIPAAMQAIRDAQDAHLESHRPAVTHIRKQINPRRIRTGNQFYKNKVKLSAAEDGSQTLCGADPTIEDMGYGETRHASSLTYVSCEDCKKIRTTTLKENSQ